jgi:hypothetical protein
MLDSSEKDNKFPFWDLVNHWASIMTNPDDGESLDISELVLDPSEEDGLLEFELFEKNILQEELDQQTPPVLPHPVQSCRIKRKR